MSHQIHEFSFRLQCVKHYFKDLFEKLSPPQTSTKDVRGVLIEDHCCGTCEHVCVICNGDCLNKPSCMKLPCKKCGFEAKDCQAENILKSWIVFEEIAKIQQKECEDFIVNKIPLKSFPYCKTTNQLLSTYVHDAVKTCSQYFLNKNQIQEDDHLDSQMYARMILRLPAKVLRHSFSDVKFNPHNDEEDLRNPAHQAEGIVLINLLYYFLFTNSIPGPYFLRIALLMKERK